MDHSEREVRDEGDCRRVTVRGEDACEEVRKRRVCTCSPPGPLPVQALRLRTETSYKAGSTRRVSTTTSRSRSQSVAQANGELVQRTRMYGGLGAGRCNPSGYPILPARCLIRDVSVQCACRPWVIVPEAPVRPGQVKFDVVIAFFVKRFRKAVDRVRIVERIA